VAIEVTDHDLARHRSDAYQGMAELRFGGPYRSSLLQPDLARAPSPLAHPPHRGGICRPDAAHRRRRTIA